MSLRHAKLSDEEQEAAELWVDAHKNLPVLSREEEVREAIDWLETHHRRLDQLAGPIPFVNHPATRTSVWCVLLGLKQPDKFDDDGTDTLNYLLMYRSLRHRYGGQLEALPV